MSNAKSINLVQNQHNGAGVLLVPIISPAPPDSSEFQPAKKHLLRVHRILLQSRVCIIVEFLNIVICVNKKAGWLGK
jgi:hypothetical protein